MQKIIPFKKEIVFKDRIDEIVSISMDHHLMREDYKINGNFIVEGEYINNDKKEAFHFDIPYSGSLDEDYNVEKCTLDIDDFYYEILEPNKLSIHIDILVDKLSEKPLIEDIPILEDLDNTRNGIVEEEISTKEEVVSLVEESNAQQVEKVLNDKLEEAYMTYKVYIVREGDTLSSILEKYQINEENLRKYNVINELSLGDKLIIPYEKN